MKKIATVQKLHKEGVKIIDYYAFKDCDGNIKAFLPYNKLYDKIILRGFPKLTKGLLNALVNQYLHGATIVVHTKYKQLYKEYTLKAHFAKDMYSYNFTDFDFKKPIPKRLAYQEIKDDKYDTFIDLYKTLTSCKYLPKPLWDAIDIYSKELIRDCRKYNQGIYWCAEEWLKQLYKDCRTHEVYVESPNLKTAPEAEAEMEFELKSKQMQLSAKEKPLRQDQIDFLYKYAKVYGVDIPQFSYRINSRKTKHGYTQEPEVVYNTMTDTDWNRVAFDERNKDNLPGFVRKGLVIQSYENQKLLKEAYKTLSYLIKTLGDEAFMPGWHRCPHCNAIYHEQEGCDCGAIPPIEILQANNLFYSSTSEWEDYAATKNYDEEDYE